MYWRMGTGEVHATLGGCPCHPYEKLPLYRNFNLVLLLYLLAEYIQMANDAHFAIVFL